MLLPRPKSAKPSKSTARKLLDFVSSANDHLRSIFVAPRSVRRRAANVHFCLHSLAGLQSLEARLLLTGPTAVNDAYYASMYGTLSIPAYAGVLENDYGGSEPLSAVLISGPSDGSLTLNSDGSFTYSNFMYAYGDSFTYEATEGTNYSNIATVSLSFSGSSQPTIVADDNYTVVHDRTLNVSAANGVLAGASDPNGLHLTAVLTSAPSSGSLTLNSDGSFSYTPATHYVG
ncbi:MAG TPA: Ig-like domain-containing protein, partial [Pirellulales bacterium]|nr:Ig-like domain-containing protein [Pirellulales bacterium]